MYTRVKILCSRIFGLFARERRDQDFNDEIQEHLALLEKEFERRGLSPEEARYAAKRQFGGITQLKEVRRESRSIPQFDVLSRDIRYAFRAIRKAPGFSLTVVLMLGLGIGANSAIFTLADQMLLRLLPVKDPQKLVLLNDDGIFIGGSCRPCKDTFSYPAYLELRNSARNAFTGIAARYQAPVDIAVNGSAQRAEAEIVSGNYFGVLGVNAVIGRTLAPEDATVKLGDPYVVLSYSYWRRRFGGNPAILNRSINLNGHSMTIIGVAPKGFLGFDEASPSDVFVPMTMKPVVTTTWDDMERRNSTWLRMFARLKQGVSVKVAEAAIAGPFKGVLREDLAAVHRDERFSEQYMSSRIVLESASKGFNNLEDTFGKPIYVLSVMVGLLLLIACVNVANLVLARSSARQKEMAVRLALGATRMGLVRLALSESMILAAFGSLVGLLLSYWISGLLVTLLPIENGGALISAVPNASVLCFTAGLTVLTVLLFGLTPALQSTRPDVAPTLKNESASASLAASQIVVRRLLIFAQVTLSVLLLIGAGLFALSLQKLMSVDTGIRPTHLLAFLITPSRHRYTAQQSRQYFLDLQNRLDHLPGVTSASAAEIPILSGQNESNTVHVEGYRPRPGESMQPSFNAVLPDFFTTMGIPLIAGRDFNQRDTAGRPKAVIVNEAFAKRYVPHGSPVVGLHLGWFGQGPMDYQIVGVVKNSKQSDLREEAKPCTYISVFQYPAAALPDLTFYVRTVHSPLMEAQQIRRAVAQIDSSIPVSKLKTLEMQIDETQTMDRLFAWLSVAFAATATLLASIGLYGLMAFLVTRRKLEIGIRLALGAERGQVLKLIMKDVLVLTLAGMTCGLLLAVSLAHLIQSQLYGIKATDSSVVVLASLSILAVCCIAGYLPARRATKIDPSVILRHQ
jgi:Acidobacterial duplicated orphan permease